MRPKKAVLTRRERQILRCLLLGLPNKEIAFQLGLTEGAVKVYLCILGKKIGKQKRTDILLWIGPRQYLLRDDMELAVPEGAD